MFQYFQVNECRLALFSKKNRALDGMPPTEAALFQHTLRAAYQGGQVWGQSTIANPELPDPCTFGWIKEEGIFKPMWTTLPSASVSCDELVSCKCKISCKGLCRCYRSSLPCTTLCACDGDCRKQETDFIEQEVEEDDEVDHVLDITFDESDVDVD